MRTCLKIKEVFVVKKLLATVLSICMLICLTACDAEGWTQPDFPTYEDGVESSEIEDNNSNENDVFESEPDVEPEKDDMIEYEEWTVYDMFFEMERQLYSAQNINMNILFVDTAENWDCSLVWDKFNDEYALEIKDSVSGEFENTYVTNDDGFRYYKYSKYEHVTDVGYTNKIEKFVTMINNIIDMEPFYKIDDSLHDVNGVSCYRLSLDLSKDIQYYDFDFILYVNASTLQLVRIENTEEEYQTRYIIDIEMDTGDKVSVPQKTLDGASNAYEELNDDVQEDPGYREYFGQSAEALNVTMGDFNIWIGMDAEELFDNYTNKSITSMTTIEAPFKTKNRINMNTIPKNSCGLYTISTKSGQASQILVAIKNTTDETINKKDGIVCGIYYIMDSYLPCDTKNVQLNAGFEFDEITFGKIKNIMAGGYRIADPITVPARGFDCIWADSFVQVRLNINDERVPGYLFIEDDFCAEYHAEIRDNN